MHERVHTQLVHISIVDVSIYVFMLNMYIAQVHALLKFTFMSVPIFLCIAIVVCLYRSS